MTARLHNRRVGIAIFGHRMRAWLQQNQRANGDQDVHGLKRPVNFIAGETWLVVLNARTGSQSERDAAVQSIVELWALLSLRRLGTAVAAAGTRMRRHDTSTTPAMSTNGDERRKTSRNGNQDWS